MQVLCGLQVVFFLFNCQTPDYLGVQAADRYFASGRQQPAAD